MAGCQTLTAMLLDSPNWQKTSPQWHKKTTLQLQAVHMNKPDNISLTNRTSDSAAALALPPGNVPALTG
jgi:hypothetical protein